MMIARLLFLLVTLVDGQQICEPKWRCADLSQDVLCQDVPGAVEIEDIAGLDLPGCINCSCCKPEYAHILVDETVSDPDVTVITNASSVKECIDLSFIPRRGDQNDVWPWAVGIKQNESFYECYIFLAYNGEKLQTSASFKDEEGMTLYLRENTCKAYCDCPCDAYDMINKVSPYINLTYEEKLLALQGRIAEIQMELGLNKKNVSKVVRNTLSAPDKRVSAKVVGVMCGVMVLTFMIAAIIGLDLPNLLSIFKQIYWLTEEVCGMCKQKMINMKRKIKAERKPHI
ncbi:hypothetical protein ACJMK2_042578 [Sinanodonta woodiana]|uniref:Uncharacterized protein n=1 Tax=Sinanodonta woodiana TaxID=1069815 RepID=A0ABD3W9P4_SINWO